MPTEEQTGLSAADTQALADALLAAFENGEAVAPPTEQHPGLSVQDAYAVQQRVVAGHVALGRRVVGRKIGLTSLAMQEQLGIDAPDFGVVLDSHTFPSGSTLSRSGYRMLLPRLEPELAFVLERPLRGPGVTDADVLAATGQIVPVLEVIDSRVVDWRIGLSDTVADNASCFGVILGEPVALADAGALPDVTVSFARDDEVLQTGRGEAVLGDPVRAITWLANALGALGDELPAGEPILAGSFTAAVEAADGTYTADFGAAIGTVTVEMED